MKKKLLICIFTLMCLFITLAGCAPQASRSAFAETSDNSITTVSNTSAEQTNRVAVIGSASVTLVPDMAEIIFDITTDGDTATDVTTQNEKAADKVTADLISSGIKKEDIQTTGFSVYPEYTYDDQGKKASNGYTATTSIAVTIRSIDSIGKTVDQAIKSGANGAYGITYSLSNGEAKYNELLAQSYEVAKKKADALAAAAGKKTDGVVYMEENQQAYEMAMPQTSQTVSAAKETASENTDTKFEPGSMEISAQVQFVFALK